MNTPTENTLTLNVTHQLLKKVEKNFTNAVAFSPSRRMEKLKGYDVKLSFCKFLVFQFKRPKFLNPATMMKRIRFDLNSSQLFTLHRDFTQFDHAFFALPIVLNANELKYSYLNTFYIDINNILPNTSFIDFVLNPNKLNFKAKIKNGTRYDIKYFKRNITMNRNIKNCNYGLTIYQENKLSHEYKQFIGRIEEINKNILNGDEIPENWMNEKISEMIKHQKKLIEKEKISCDDEVDFDEMRDFLRNQFYELKKESSKKIGFDPSTYKIRSSKINIFEKND